MLRRRLLPLLTVLAIGAVSACGAAGADPGSGAGKLRVAAAFYPLQFAAEQVGGEHVQVIGLTKPGGEPHDVELTPKEVAGLARARVVVYEKGFQPAVDQAVASQAADRALDVSGPAKLDLKAVEEDHDHPQAADGGNAEREGQDPHFWLDPTRYAAVARAVGERFAAVDPAHAADYRANAAAMAERLSALDREFATGLKSCAEKDLVTSHAAFGYLARRYGLVQQGISGISPDQEPNAAQMREVVERVTDDGVKTIYSETLVSPALADTIAKETGATVAVLDPIEGVTKASSGRDYFEIMRSNLATLVRGQGCS